MSRFRRSIGMRALLAGATIVLSGLATIPAQAGGVPVLVRTSVDSGWSNHRSQVAARFDRALSASSSASLVDRNGTPVAGQTQRPSTDYRVLIFTADELGCGCPPLSASRAPFTITFTAISSGDGPGTSEVVRTFMIDTIAPVPPSLEGSRIRAILPDGAVQVSGRAVDPTGPAPLFSTEATSGIQRVEVHVYNPLESIASPLLDGDLSDLRGGLDALVRSLGDELVERRVTIASSCSAGLCPQSVTFSTEVELSMGLWALKVLAYDLAGNRSGPSHDVIIVRVG